MENVMKPIKMIAEMLMGGVKQLLKGKLPEGDPAEMEAMKNSLKAAGDAKKQAMMDKANEQKSKASGKINAAGDKVNKQVDKANDLKNKAQEQADKAKDMKNQAEKGINDAKEMKDKTEKEANDVKGEDNNFSDQNLLTI